MGVNPQKLLDVRSELAARGFWFDRNDRSWRHKSGALMSDAAIDDVQRFFGLVTVAKLLDAIDGGALEWDLLVDTESSTDETRLTIKVEKRALLDVLAKI
jgi:hypothetical protein